MIAFLPQNMPAPHLSRAVSIEYQTGTGRRGYAHGETRCYCCYFQDVPASGCNLSQRLPGEPPPCRHAPTARVAGTAPSQHTQRFVQRLRVNAACDEYDAGAAVRSGPSREQLRWLKQVLHTMNHHRLFRVFGQMHDAFDAQHILAAHRDHGVQPIGKAFAGQRVVAHDDFRRPTPRRPTLVRIPTSLD